MLTENCNSEDNIEAKSFRHGRNYIDIYSVGWGPSDMDLSVDGPGPLTQRLALPKIEGAEKDIDQLLKDIHLTPLL